MTFCPSRQWLAKPSRQQLTQHLKLSFLPTLLPAFLATFFTTFLPAFFTTFRSSGPPFFGVSFLDCFRQHNAHLRQRLGCLQRFR